VTSNSKAAGRFGKQDFRYVPEKDVYICPADERLARHYTNEENGSVQAILVIHLLDRADLEALSEATASRKSLGVHVDGLPFGAPKCDGITGQSDCDVLSAPLYRLTYTSCQESGKLRGLCRRLAAQMRTEEARIRAALNQGEPP
jgi:hypothetical protein